MRPAVTRFAPSPTGRLHVGNARTALINWLAARQSGGSFLLRLDDTDAERSTETFARGIRDDLAWLGLDVDREERQSARFDRYGEARERLAVSGRLYPCYETPQELAAQRNLLRARGLPPVYDRSALALADDERRALEAEGRRPHWRFRLAGEPVVFDDLVRGRVRFEPGHVSDPVLVREDGVPTYMLASVVDDLDMGVTLVIRGEDHVANTAVQVELAKALGGAPPDHAHHPLMAAADGSGLSKRGGAGSIAELRDEGIEAMALLGYLARIGTSDPVEPVHAIGDLVTGFSLDRISRNPPRHDPDDVRALNVKWLHGAPFEAVAGRLDGIGQGFWEIVRGNVERLSEAGDWWRICRGDIEPVIDDPGFCEQARALLPDEPWDGTVWEAWTDALGEATGRRGRDVFRPLRLALTGRADGPRLADLLPVIGRDRALRRLSGAGQEPGTG